MIRWAVFFFDFTFCHFSLKPLIPFSTSTLPVVGGLFCRCGLYRFHNDWHPKTTKREVEMSWKSVNVCVGTSQWEALGRGCITRLICCSAGTRHARIVCVWHAQAIWGTVRGHLEINRGFWKYVSLEKGNFLPPCPSWTGSVMQTFAA